MIYINQTRDLPTKKEFLNTFGSVIDEAIDSLVLNEGVDENKA